MTAGDRDATGCAAGGSSSRSAVSNTELGCAGAGCASVAASGRGATDAGRMGDSGYDQPQAVGGYRIGRTEGGDSGGGGGAPDGGGRDGDAIVWTAGYAGVWRGGGYGVVRTTTGSEVYDAAYWTRSLCWRSSLGRRPGKTDRAAALPVAEPVAIRL